MPNQNLTTLATLIGDDSHACSFQSLGQYRAALLKVIAQSSAQPASVAVPEADWVMHLLSDRWPESGERVEVEMFAEWLREVLATAPHPVSGDLNPEHTLFNEIRASMPVNEDDEPTRYIITEAQLQSIRSMEFRQHPVSGEPFQARVLPWLRECFGQAIADDQTERNHRFLEEALELVQSCGCTEDEAHKLVAYVYGRAVGERSQEVGGVMVMLAALCLSQRLDMHQCGETELARITQPAMVEKIREKQKRKPAMSPLAGSYGDREQFDTPPDAQDVAGLVAFANAMIDIAFEGGDADGGQIQEAAEKHGLLVKHERQSRCREEFCNCAIYGFPIDCYVRSEQLRGCRAQQGEQP